MFILIFVAWNNNSDLYLTGLFQTDRVTVESLDLLAMLDLLVLLDPWDHLVLLADLETVVRP